MTDIPEKSTRQRLEKIKLWFKNPYNLILVGILVFAFALRLFFFLKTSNQALWWDEASYMSTAKHWAFDVPFDLNPQRPPLFQFLAAFSFMIGFGEIFIKFAFSTLPSLLLVFLVYLLGKEMFDKKIGLIAAFLTAVSWTFLFWSVRVQPDFLSMCFQVLAILFMWKHWKNEKTKFVVLAGVFSVIALMFKVSALLVPLIFLVFIFGKERFSAFKNKYNYYYLSAFIITLIPYMVWSYLTFGTPLGFRQGYSSAIGAPTPFGWYNLGFFYSLTENILFVLFLIGLILSFKFLLYLDILIKDKKRGFDPNIFSILTLVIVSAFYIFYIRGTEDRWVFLWLPFIFMMAGNALNFIYKIGRKYSKIISVGLVIILLAWGGYAQISHANSIIEDKKESYMPVKQAGLWIKENSNPGDKIATLSYTQMVYYTERDVRIYPILENIEEFDEYMSENRPRFFIISVFEPQLFKEEFRWVHEWLDKNQDRAVPVQAYFSDVERKQPLLIIYQIKYDVADSESTIKI